MPQDFHHGVRVIEINEGTRYIRVINTSIIGFVATAADADAEAFPLDKAVLITDVSAAKGKAGTQGTLYKTLSAIESQTNPVCVVVRVAEGTDEAETTSNVIGTTTEDNKRTGLQALLVAESQLTVRPRILGAPGLDNQEVTNAMITIAQKLRAFVYAKAQGKNVAEWSLFRDEFGARELMLITPDFEAWNTQTNATEVMWATACALGLRAKIDNEQGWHKSLSNVAVNGPTGISADISWDLQSSNTDAGILNEADVTTLINCKGYRFWGNRTCSADTLFAFETYTRTAQILADTIAEACFTWVDGVMIPNNVKDIVETVNAKLRQLTTEGYIIGGSCWYDPAINTKETLKAGKLGITYDYTPCPPMEDITFQQKITDVYWADFNAAVTQG